MSTRSERLEAEIWLDGSGQELSDAQRTTFFAHVDNYYVQNPTATRRADALRALRDDHAAFGRILDVVRSSTDEDRIDISS